MDFSEAVAATFCERVASGRTVLSVSKDEDMPPTKDIRRWQRHNPAFAEQLLQARDEMADRLAEQVIEIADNEPDPQKARNRIDVRKWFAGVVRPKAYGPRVGVDLVVEDKTDMGALRRIAIERLARFNHPVIDITPEPEQIPFVETPAETHVYVVPDPSPVLPDPFE